MIHSPLCFVTQTSFSFGYFNKQLLWLLKLRRQFFWLLKWRRQLFWFDDFITVFHNSIIWKLIHHVRVLIKQRDDTQNNDDTTVLQQACLRTKCWSIWLKVHWNHEILDKTLKSVQLCCYRVPSASKATCRRFLLWNSEVTRSIVESCVRILVSAEAIFFSRSFLNSCENRLRYLRTSLIITVSRRESDAGCVWCDIALMSLKVPWFSGLTLPGRDMTRSPTRLLYFRSARMDRPNQEPKQEHV